MVGNEGCCRCEKVFGDGDDKLIHCSVCKHVMHIQCFAEMADLKAQPSSAKARSTRSKNGEQGADTVTMSETEIRAISAALEADCVLVVCQQCQEKADVTMLLQKLSDTANQSAIKVQQLNKQVECLEAGLQTIRRELTQLSALPAPEDLKNGLDEIEAMRTQFKEQETLPERLTYAETTVKNLQSTVKKTEEEWHTVKTKTASTTEPADITRTVRDSVKVIKEEELRRRNILIYNVPEPKTETADTDKRADITFFNREIAEICEVPFVPEDIDDCIRLGARTDDKKRPILVKFSDAGARKKKLLFQHMQKFRKHQRDNRGPEDAGKPLITLADDLTEDQRKTRKDLLTDATLRNSELPQDADFLWAVRGPAWDMQLKKVVKRRQ